MTAKLMAGKVFEKILRKYLHNSKKRFTFANANGKEVFLTTPSQANL
ncbi:MAG: hypothetical protein HDS77_04750 [Bacteroidales bacterium]|nr:hypothetical protein [Bacteroidales bacterium]